MSVFKKKKKNRVKPTIDGWVEYTTKVGNNTIIAFASSKEVNLTINNIEITLTKDEAKAIVNILMESTDTFNNSRGWYED